MSTKETTFTLRVDEQLKNRFSELAKEEDRSAAQLVRDFMRSFVQQHQSRKDHDEWFRTEIQAGIESANAGRVQTSDDVEAFFAQRRAATRDRLVGKA